MSASHAQVPEEEAVSIMGRLSPLNFWRNLHRMAVTATVGFSESKFAQLERDAQDSAFQGETWLPHVQAVVDEASRIRKIRS